MSTKWKLSLRSAIRDLYLRPGTSSVVPDEPLIVFCLGHRLDAFPADLIDPGLHVQIIPTPDILLPRKVRHGSRGIRRDFFRYSYVEITHYLRNIFLVSRVATPTSSFHSVDDVLDIRNSA